MCEQTTHRERAGLWRQAPPSQSSGEIPRLANGELAMGTLRVSGARVRALMLAKVRRTKSRDGGKERKK